MIRCTKCGEKINLQEGQAENEYIEIIRLLPYFGNHSRLAFEYVELFSVIPLRMKGKKILRILTGLAQIFSNEKFVFDRTEYKISRAGVVEALTTVCNKHFSTPLENNHYLCKVMIGISEREMKASRDAEDKALKEREKKRAGANGQTHGSAPTGDGRKTLAEFKKAQGVESLADLVGKTI